MASTRKPVRRPHERVKRNVRNQSSRHGSKIRGIVIHSTEGADAKGIADLVGLGNYFDRAGVDASSHVGIDAEGMSAKYVDDAAKAWTCAGYNPQTLNIELIGFASFTKQKWEHREEQLRKCAMYIAYWCKKYDIPIKVGKVSNGTVTEKGILRHSDLGAIGGGHHDPGSGFPMDRVLRKARYLLANGWPS